MAYLVAPPIEASIGLDAALKAADVRGVKVMTPPTETNFAAGGEAVFRPPSPGLFRYFLFAVTEGIALLRGNRSIRVVFGGSVLMAPIVVLLARLFRRKAVIQAHGLDLIHRHGDYQFCIVRCLRYADRVIANSRHTASLAGQKGVAGAPSRSSLQALIGSASKSQRIATP